MSTNKVIKSVSFNQKNKDDEIILNHVKRRNFSGYVKKLILADIRKKQNETNVQVEIKTKLTTTQMIEQKKVEMKKGQKTSAPSVFIPNHQKH